jgi:hypothetical protein
LSSADVRIFALAYQGGLAKYSYETTDGGRAVWCWQDGGGDPGHNHFEISRQGSPLGSEDLPDGHPDPAALERRAALLTPGGRPEEIASTVSSRGAWRDVDPIA